MTETKPTRRFAREPKPQDVILTAAGASEPAPLTKSKIAVVIGLLDRPGGASLEELVVATGWQPHTTRAALTGLRKKGRDVTSAKADGIRAYRIVQPVTAECTAPVDTNDKLDA